MNSTDFKTYRKPCREGHLDCIGRNASSDACQSARKCKNHQWMDLRVGAVLTQQCGRCGKERA